MNATEVTGKLDVLVIEDNPHTAQLVKIYLERDGHTVSVADNGGVGLELAQQNNYSIIVLDLMLPEIDGREICRRIRLKSDVPVIMVTARVAEEDRLKGLELGADDYITKPFSPRELVARVYNIMRRSTKSRVISDDLEFGDLVIAPQKQEVRIKNTVVSLTNTEFGLLLILARSPKHTLAREQLVAKLANNASGDSSDRSRVLDAHISNLRRKIGKNAQNEDFVKSVYGVGYKFNP